MTESHAEYCASVFNADMQKEVTASLNGWESSQKFLLPAELVSILSAFPQPVDIQALVKRKYSKWLEQAYREFFNWWVKQ